MRDFQAQKIVEICRLRVYFRAVQKNDTAEVLENKSDKSNFNTGKKFLILRNFNFEQI